MLQLREAVFEQCVLGGDQLATPVDCLFKDNRRRLVLQAGHFESFHHDFVMLTGRMCRAAIVDRNDFDRPCLDRVFILEAAIFESVFDGDLRACPQFFDEVTSGVRRVLARARCQLRVDIRKSPCQRRCCLFRLLCR